MRLPDKNNYAIIRQFLTEPEHTELSAWAVGQLYDGKLKANAAGPGRFFKSYEPGGDVPDLFWRVREYALDQFDVVNYEDEPMFKCFLGCNTQGGFVHRHKDPAPPGKLHVRFNIMLSKPWIGGVPYINDEPLDVNERDLWCFYPSVLWHHSDPVDGYRKRFVISIGILVPDETLS